MSTVSLKRGFTLKGLPLFLLILIIIIILLMLSATLSTVGSNGADPRCFDEERSARFGSRELIEWINENPPPNSTGSQAWSGPVLKIKAESGQTLLFQRVRLSDGRDMVRILTDSSHRPKPELYEFPTSQMRLEWQNLYDRGTTARVRTNKVLLEKDFLLLENREEAARIFGIPPGCLD